LFGRTHPEGVKQRQAAHVAALADRMSRLKVRQTDRESDVTTVEGAGLAIADWPSTFGLKATRLIPHSALTLSKVY